MAGRRLWITIGAVVGGIILILLIAIPFLLNADNYRPRMQSMLSDATGRQVTLGHLSFSLFSGSLIADQLSISDDPAFGQQPFVQAKQLHIGIEVGPLIFHKQILIRSITIDTPKINLIQNQANKWNYASLGNSAKRSNKPETQSSMPNLSIGVLEVKDGQVTITDLGEPAPPRVIQNVQAKVSDFSLTTPFTYSLSASFSGNGTVSVERQGRPLQSGRRLQDPLHRKGRSSNTLTSWPEASCLPPPVSRALRIVNADITSNGQTAHIQGTIDASQLKLAANGSPAPRPVHVNFAVNQNLASLSGQLQNTTLAFDKALFNIAGTYQTQGAKTSLNVTAATQGAPVNDLEDFLPHLASRCLPARSCRAEPSPRNSPSPVPSDAPVIAGPVRLDNTQLAGFDLGSKMGPAAALVGAQARQRHHGTGPQSRTCVNRPVRFRRTTSCSTSPVWAPQPAMAL